MVKPPWNNSEKQGLFFPLIIFFAALLLRLVYLFTSRNNPFFSTPIVDMDYFWRFAGDLLANGPFGVSPLESAWKPVLYPFFLAGVRFFAGDGIFNAQILQSVLGSLNCVLLYCIAKQYFNSRTSLLAGLLMAFYGTFIFYDACVLPVTLNTFLVLCFLLSVSGLQQDKRTLPWFVPGIFIALAANTHQIILASVPVIPIVQYYWYRDAAGKRSFPAAGFFRAVSARSASFLCGVLIVMAIFASVKYAQTRDLSAPSNNAGVNFYIGNNAHADGVSVPPEGVAWMRLINEPVVGRQLTNDKSGHSSYFYRKAFGWIAAHPLSFVTLYGKKLAYCFSAVEIKNNVNMYRYGDYSPLLRCLLWATPYFSFPFGIVFPLAIIGIWLSYRNGPRRFLHFYLYLIAVPAGTALFFVCARYRMLSVPVLLLFAAFTIDYLVNAIGNGKWEKSYAYIFGLLVVSTMVCNCHNRFLMKLIADEDYLDFQQLGKIQFGLNHEYAAAEESMADAIALNPSYADSYYYMAAIQREKGDTDQALASLKTTLAIDPKYQEARELLAEIEIQQGDYKKAEAELLNVLFSEEDWYGFISPENAAQRLGNLYFSIYGNLPAAAAFHERYLQFNPDEKLPANKNLAIIKKFLSECKERDYRVMIDYLQNVLKNAPGNTIAQRQLSEILARQKIAAGSKPPS